MSYVWGEQGPAFEYPTCFRTENRFLTLRGAVLFVCALVVAWVALAEPDAPAAGAALLRVKAERASSVPHLVAAALLLALGVLDLLAAARQRRVLLAPGQPASLTNELLREAAGVRTGAEWLIQVLRSGTVLAAEMHGAYKRPLLATVRHIVTAPNTLRAYLRVRLAHLLFAAGLLLALAVTWLLVTQPPPLALAALLYGGLAAALAAHSAWISRAAPSPTAVMAALALALIGGLLMGWFADKVPQVARLQALELPVAAVLLLGAMLLIEGLGFMAGRAQVQPPPKGSLQGSDAVAEFVAEPDRLMQEVEREFQRLWADGVPSRRHAWQPPGAGPKADRGGVWATMLEETQPAVPAARAGHKPAPRPNSNPAWLLALDSLGLLLTVIGGVLWVRLANAHMLDATASWAAAAPSLVLVVAGGYALRVGHLLWSRMEVESTLHWVEFKSVPEQVRKAAAGAPPTPTAHENASGARLLNLRASAVRVRSIFYAAGEHPIGSRTLTRLVGDGAAARRLAQHMQAYAERAGADTVDADKARPAAVTATPAQASRPTAGTQPLPRFCSKCGTQVLQAGRFCQHCGGSLVQQG